MEPTIRNAAALDWLAASSNIGSVALREISTKGWEVSKELVSICPTYAAKARTTGNAASCFARRRSSAAS